MTVKPRQIAELRESFRYNDFDKDGRIDLGEFIEMLEQLEAQVSRQEARIGFGEIDSDDDGTIDFEEFMGWWSGR